MPAAGRSSPSPAVSADYDPGRRRTYRWAVIVLDTNQLERAQPPDGPLLAMLQTVAKQAGQDLQLPEMALEEHLSHYRAQLAEADRERVKAVRTLQRLVRYFNPRDPGPFEVERAVEDRAEQLKRIFGILNTSDYACKEALLREARRQPPAAARWDRPGKGARDVAIWLTAVGACKEKGEDVYFVAQDKDAFGERELLPELVGELAATLGGRASAFHYCYGIPGLLDLFASKHDADLRPEQIAGSERVRAAVVTSLDSTEVVAQLAAGGGLLSGLTAGIRIGQPVLELVSLGRAMAYRVGDATWASAQPEWDVDRDFATTSLSAADLAALGNRTTVRITFKIRTTLIMQLSDEGEVTEAEVTGRSQPYDIRVLLVG